MVNQVSQLYLNICDFIVLHTDALILMIIAFILAIWIIPETQNSSSKSTAATIEPHHADLDNDYNFMETHESIPAHFDLAIAFASMGNLDKAMSILHQLAQSNHLETRQKATVLMESLPSKVDALNSQ